MLPLLVEMNGLHVLIDWFSAIVLCYVYINYSWKNYRKIALKQPNRPPTMIDIDIE